MTDHRTEVEKDLQNIIQEMMDIFQAGPRLKLTHEGYMDLMGDLKNAKIHLENKRMGCKSGKHACSCLCEAGIEKAVDAIKRERKVA